jgi:hypothetical protein|tara:strand:+ start:1518 stop:1760 length:243 start_codon:yes stop_codon:yes gene_type:complete
MERRLGLKLEDKKIEIRADKEVGDKWIGYQHFVITHAYVQHHFELRLKPAKIGLVIIGGREFMITLQFFGLFVSFGTGIR